MASVPDPAAASPGEAPPVGPLARAAELELRLREERSRRERAEALAEVASARVALLEARAAAADEARRTGDGGRDVLLGTLGDGLATLRDELDALRALAVASSAEGPAVAAATSAARAVPPRSSLDPTLRMGELARGARELLAGGRLEAADEVIRGLEDAAERLRAQSPPPEPGG